MSCHDMSCHVMSCHVMSCHVMSCHVMSRHVMSCHVKWSEIMLCQEKWSQSKSSKVKWSQVKQRMMWFAWFLIQVSNWSLFSNLIFVSYPSINDPKNFIPQQISFKKFHTPVGSLPPRSRSNLMTAPLFLIGQTPQWRKITLGHYYCCYCCC